MVAEEESQKGSEVVFDSEKENVCHSRWHFAKAFQRLIFRSKNLTLYCFCFFFEICHSRFFLFTPSLAPPFVNYPLFHYFSLLRFFHKGWKLAKLTFHSNLFFARLFVAISFSWCRFFQLTCQWWRRRMNHPSAKLEQFNLNKVVDVLFFLIMNSNKFVSNVNIWRSETNFLKQDAANWKTRILRKFLFSIYFAIINIFFWLIYKF